MGLNINIYLCLYKLNYICEPRDLDSLFMSIYKQHTEACVSKESDLEMLTSLPEAEMPHSFHLTSRKTGFRKPTTPGICSLPCLADQMPEKKQLWGARVYFRPLLGSHQSTDFETVDSGLWWRIQRRLPAL